MRDFDPARSLAGRLSVEEAAADGGAVRITLFLTCMRFLFSDMWGVFFELVVVVVVLSGWRYDDHDGGEFFLLLSLSF